MMQTWYEANKEREKAWALKWHFDNRERSLERQREWHLKNRDVVNRRRVLRRYNLTEEQYQEILERQGGVCAICHGPPTGKNGRRGNFSIDHCHKTGRVRGLLCEKCNKAIGLFQDSPENLLRAAEYIK